MDGKKSKATQDWEDALLHPHKEKAGFLPRAAGETEIEKIPQAAPSHGISDRGKDSFHGRQHPGKPYPENATVGVTKQSGSTISKESHPQCYPKP